MKKLCFKCFFLISDSNSLKKVLKEEKRLKMTEKNCLDQLLGASITLKLIKTHNRNLLSSMLNFNGGTHTHRIEIKTENERTGKRDRCKKKQKMYKFESEFIIVKERRKERKK